MMTIGSLFSGIGGLELGLEWAGLGPVLWQVEIDPYARAVLEAHWPEAKRYDDVRAVGETTLAAVDLICGGFPCQDVSSAGKRAGIGGARSGLWTEFRRIVLELFPKWVVVENVASGADAWVDHVARELAELGYAVFPVPLAAADVGAPHERARIFVIAYIDREGKLARSVDAKMAAPPCTADAERLLVRNERWGRCGSSRASQAVAAHVGWRSSMPSMVRVAHGVSGRLHGSHKRIRALGNAVVPQCAEVIGHIIRELS